MAGRKPGDAVSELISIANTMRELGVVKYSGHGIEVLLGPAPMSESERRQQEKEKKDPRATKRNHYSLLLGHVPTDAALDMLP